MTKYKVEKYLEKLTNGTSFWFHVGIASDESEIGLDIHGENPPFSSYLLTEPH